MNLMKRSRAVARGVVSVLLFAQLAMAANACLAATSERAQAVAAAAHETCDMQDRNLNLCLYHCGDQYSGNPPALDLTPPVSGTLLAPAMLDAGTVPGQVRVITTRATGPPLAIRHCRFQT
jgi:hypothetical protein